MDATPARDNKDILETKSRDELHIMAKRLGIVGYRKLSKDALIAAILEAKPNTNLASAPPPSWWSRWHNHVYGVATIIGLLLTVLFFVLQTSQKHPTNPNSQDASKPSQSEPRQDTVEKVEARIATEAAAFSPINIKDFFSQLYDTSSTDLQRDQFRKDMLGKTVIWTGKIYWIKPDDNDSISVVVNAPDGTYGEAFLKFDSSQKAEFLKLKAKQSIRFTGVIKDFISSPFLYNCRLLQIVD